MQNAKRPKLIVMCGLQGTGKTTVGAFIAQEIDARIFRTDTIRKKLFSKPAYSAQESSEVYGEMFRLAQDALAQGQNAVLDATFSLRTGRNDARLLAQKAGTAFFLLYLVCNEDVVRERLGMRGAAEESDARWPHYLEAKKLFEPPQENEQPIIIDTSGDWSGAVNKCILYINKNSTSS